MSFRASNPPGPILLLRDFLEAFSIGTGFLPPANDPISAVMFSWSAIADGICASDFRDLGRVAGNVISSCEAIMRRRSSKLNDFV